MQSEDLLEGNNNKKNLVPIKSLLVRKCKDKMNKLYICTLYIQNMCCIYIYMLWEYINKQNNPYTGSRILWDLRES